MNTRPSPEGPPDTLHAWSTSALGAAPVDLEAVLARLAEQAALLELSFDAVIVRDSTDRITYCNRGAEEMYGWSRAEALGQVTHELFQTQFPEPLPDIQEKLRRNGRWSGELLHTRRDGSRIIVDTRWALQGDAAGNVTRILETNTDVTESKKLQQELLSISEREQRRLGQDLHDDLCQQLAGIELLSQTLVGALARSLPSSAGQAAEIAAMVRQVMLKTRELARGLSPLTEGPEGLMLGLQELAVRTEKIFGKPCRFSCPAPVLVADPSMALHLYRIAQEAISNALKHASARHLEIGLNTTGQGVTLEVSDDGLGIPPNPDHMRGMGLRTMQYRAKTIGGSLFLRRNSEGGTTVICGVRNSSHPLSDAS